MSAGFDRTVRLERSIWKLFAWLVVGAIAFCVIDFVGNRSGWVHADSLRRIFNIAREDSLHNFVSSVQELAIAGVALVMYLHARRTETRFARFEWGVALAFFTWVGLDDGAALHERIGTAAENGVAFFPSYAWQIIFVPIFTVALLVTGHVLFRTRRAPYTRELFVLAFGCYIVAVGLDYIEGHSGTYGSIASFFNVRYGVVSHYFRVVEEFLEDIGASLFLVTLLRHLLYTVGSFRIAVVGGAAADAADGSGAGLESDSWQS